VEVKVVGEPTASDASPLRDDVMAAVTRVVRKRYPGLRVAPQQASGATDGKVFRAIGIPTYGVDGIFMKNSDMFAHGLNEHVPVQSFYDSLEFWHALLTDLAGAGDVRQ
jgi:acetylornithine deacetylase/succinyl-diaminopimelate desuccinylase-like protein